MSDELEYGYVVPDDYNFKRSPDELLELMGKATWEFENATKRLRKLEATKVIKIAQVKVMLLSRSISSLTNEGLKKHLNLCFQDPKFKFTNETLESFIQVELNELLSEYNYFDKIARASEKECEMWNRQLMYYQSENKLKGIELLKLGAEK